jgi:hypothetical protein
MRAIFVFGGLLIAAVITEYFLNRVGDLKQFISGIPAWYLVDDKEIGDTASLMVEDSDYEGKVRINPKSLNDAEHYINIYVFRTLRGTPYARFSPCAFMGEYNLILCDLAAITGFRNKWSLSQPVGGRMQANSGTNGSIATSVPKETEAASNQIDWKELRETLGTQRRELILLWMIGHEIGHIVAKHHAANSAALFGTAPSRLCANRDMEREADLFVVRKILSLDDATVWLIQFSGILYREYAALLTTNTKIEYSNWEPWEMIKHPVYLRDPGTGHPPMLLRILNLVKTLRDDHPYADSTDYYEQMEKNIIVMQK